MCCQLSASARQQLAEGKLTPALSLWRDVVAADASSPYRKRLKCIMALTNPADCNLDAISSGLVKTYNAKPFMCRTTGATFWLPWPRPHNACLAPAAAVSQPTTQSPRLTTRLGQAAPSAARRVAHWSYTRLPPARSCRSCRAHDRKLRPLSSAPAPRRTGFYYKTDRYFGVEADVHKWGIMALQVRAPSSSHHHPHHLPTHAIPFLTVACTPHTIVRSPPTTHATLHRSPPSTARHLPPLATFHRSPPSTAHHLPPLATLHRSPGVQYAQDNDSEDGAALRPPHPVGGAAVTPPLHRRYAAVTLLLPLCHVLIQSMVRT